MPYLKVMQKYSFEETLRVLQTVETPENVKAFRFQEVDLWPLFRLLLLYRRTEVKVIAGDPKNLSGSTKTKLKLLKMTEKLKLVSGDRKATKGKIWVIYDENHYDELPGRRRYHKFLDPIVEKNPNRFLRISAKGIAESADFAGTPKWKISHTTHHDYFWMVSRLKISQALGEQLKDVFTPEIARIVPFHRFLRSASHVMYYVDLYGHLLDKYAPPAVLLVGYYEEQKFGLIHAANKRGIPVVDIQNGSQGKHHIMYHHWKVPVTNGYSTLPREFWCWGEHWTQRLRKSLASLDSVYRVNTCGNLWFEKLSDFSPSEMRYTKKFFPEGKARALFAVQPSHFEDTVQFLRGAMDADAERYWMIRLHPRMVGSMRLFLEALEGYENQYEMVDATRMPLREAMESAEVVVSFWSTVLLDALYQSKPAVVAHPNGKLVYGDLIDRGILHYAESPEELVETVEGIAQSPSPANTELHIPRVDMESMIDRLLFGEKAGV